MNANQWVRPICLLAGLLFAFPAYGLPSLESLDSALALAERQGGPALAYDLEMGLKPKKVTALADDTLLLNLYALPPVDWAALPGSRVFKDTVYSPLLFHIRNTLQRSFESPDSVWTKDSLELEGIWTSLQHLSRESEDPVMALDHNEFRTIAANVMQAEPTEYSVWLDAVLYRIGKWITDRLDSLPWQWSRRAIRFLGQGTWLWLVLILIPLLLAPAALFLFRRMPEWEYRRRLYDARTRPETLSASLENIQRLFREGRPYLAAREAYATLLLLLELRFGIPRRAWWSHRHLKKLVSLRIPQHKDQVEGILATYEAIVYGHQREAEDKLPETHRSLLHLEKVSS